MGYPDTYELYRFCKTCGGDGVIPNPTVFPVSPENVICSECNGKGKVLQMSLDSLVDAFSEVADKLQELKTKINQMQADINYIKAKVG